ncbi:MAG: hypothetical protein U1F54_09160 [Burkholderiales bacterium]
MSASPPWRQIVIDQLRMLASEQEQLAYEQSVPHVDITAELICGWFDDSYHPEDAVFCSNFAAPELAALSEFDAAFGERMKRLPKSNGTVRCWLASPIWQEVMHAASQTLKRVAA